MKTDRQTLFLGATVLIAFAVGVGLLIASRSTTSQARPPQANSTDPRVMKDCPLQAERSYQYLQQLCAIGPRFSGSPGMRQQQDQLENHFRTCGAEVTRQAFRVRHPLDGSPVDMANLIVRWHPDRTQRVLLCAHYDTRPFPDRDPDPRRRRGPFLGANDGASGVAVLMELAHLLPTLANDVGVDMVLFDGEELVFDENRDTYFLGSLYFARKYVQDAPAERYQAAVLLDMVGDRYLQLYQEKTSLSWNDSRPLVESLWRVAEKLKIREFIARPRYEVRDDHWMLHDVAQIPACDLIDFDYTVPGTSRSFWHTQADAPEQCSGDSLAKVGWVVWEWLQQGAPMTKSR